LAAIFNNTLTMKWLSNMKNMWVILLVALQSISICLLILLYLQKPEPLPSLAVIPAELGQHNTFTTNTTAPLMSSELEKTLRMIIRSEFAALNMSAKAAPIAPPKALNTQELKQQQIAGKESTTIVSTAISKGVWTKADSQAMMQHLGSLSQEQTIALMEQLYSAINRQEMKLEDHPPF
jgi:hypothetical protein